MVGAFPVFLETYHSPNERPGQCIKCLRPAELMPEVKGTPAELCAKGEIINSTAALISNKRVCTGCSQGNV